AEGGAPRERLLLARRALEMAGARLSGALLFARQMAPWFACALRAKEALVAAEAAANHHPEQEPRQASLLRCIFNPFRSPRLEPVWLSRDVLALAIAAYDDRLPTRSELDADRLGVLADALEENGCTDPGILGHLRGPGPHVR